MVEALLNNNAVVGKKSDEILLDIDTRSDRPILLFCNARLFFGYLFVMGSGPRSGWL
jgi:hypothetical protein